jgi:glycosyltransferase involved in cell wall biosynthesis
LYPIALQRKDAYAAADYVIWLTEIACNLYSIENKNGYYIPNPSPSTITQAKKTINKKILAVGRFDDDIKQIDKILLVFKEIYKLDSEYTLDVVGYCPMDMKLSGQNEMMLETFIATTGIPSTNISFLGEQVDINKYYDDAGFLLSTSKCEGFGMVFLEAFARGLPCASFEYLGVDEIIKDGKNGATTLADEYQKLARKIVASIGDSSIYKELSRNAIDSAKQYSVSNYHRRWDALLDIVFKDSVVNIDLVKPKNELNVSSYRKVILEYEKLIKEVIREYYAKDLVEELKIAKPNRMSTIKVRFKESIDRDGVRITAEKIARKAYKKTIGR